MPDHYYNHSRRNGRSLAGLYPSSTYPGISAFPQAPQPPQFGEASLLPAVGTEVVDTTLVAPAAEAVTSKAGGLLGGLGNLPNMDQIKGIVDRLGGVDGIVSSMGKVQKVMQGFQQMAPMVKLLMSNFGKGKKSAAGEKSAEEDAALYSPKRRKKRRQGTQSRKKTAPKNRRRSTPSSVKRRRR